MKEDKSQSVGLMINIVRSPEGVVVLLLVIRAEAA